MCFDIIDHTLVEVHADAPPSASDWARMAVVRDANRHRLRANLVFAPPRSSLNAAQRADVVKFMKETGVTVAVITDSALIRGIAMALRLLGVDVRAFSSNELGRALNFLVIPHFRHAYMLQRIEGLKKQLASSSHR